MSNGGHYEAGDRRKIRESTAIDRLRIAERELEETEAIEDQIVSQRGRPWYNALIRKLKKRIESIRDEIPN